MHRLVFAIFLVLTAPAAAAGYDDFARGIAANQHDDSIAAVTAFTAAIAAGDLSPRLLPQAHRNRGLAYLRLRRCDLALADLDTALTLKPGDYDTLGIRANAHACARDFAAAFADYATMIEKSPTADAYAARGRLRWRTGDFAGAADDYAQAVRLHPKDGYAVLWLEIARIGAGTFDAKLAAKDADDVDTRQWPGRAVALYAGDATPEEVDRAAARADALPAPAQACEADFYVGEWLLAAKDVAGARARLQRTADQCPRDLAPAARIELERLK